MSNIVVISAGLSEPSATRRLADLLAQAVGRRSDAQIDTIELRPLGHDLVNAYATGFPAGELAAAVDLVEAADGLIVVTPVFSASYSGLFKMFFDVLDEGTLAGKPVLIAATAGSARHSLMLEHAMRPLFSYLKAIVVPTAVFAASEDWAAADDSLHRRIERAANELADLVSVRPARTALEDVTDFATLLGA